jgi:16S rRNA U1498 N3-methylase RsmE
MTTLPSITHSSNLNKWLKHITSDHVVFKRCLKDLVTANKSENAWEAMLKAKPERLLVPFGAEPPCLYW